MLLETPEEIGHRIKVLRVKRRLKLCQLASRLGVARQSLGAIERGKFTKLPSAPILFGLHEHLGADILALCVRKPVTLNDVSSK